MADLVIRGGTVVTASGSRRADVAVDGGIIRAIEPDLSGPAATAARVIDASGLLVLPGAVDVHTHTRVAVDERPDRFFDDSVAAAFGGTTSFLSFNNPGTGSTPAGERSLRTGLAEWLAATAADSAIDYGLSLAVSGARRRPARGTAGDHRGRGRDVEGVHDLRLPAGRSDACSTRCSVMGRARRHAPGRTARIRCC